MPMKSRAVFGAASLSLLAAGPAVMAEESQLRAFDGMAKYGVEFSADYVIETMSVLDGGIRGGTSVNGLGLAGFDVDLEKATGFWSGGSLRISALWLHGDSPTGKRIGDGQAASNIEGYDSIRFYEFFIDQTVIGGLNLRAGLLLADEEFATMEYSGVLYNSAFGWPQWVSANTFNTGPAFFVTTPGIRLRYDFNDALYVQAGIYDGDSFDDPAGGDSRKNSNGTRLHFSADQGSFSMYELGWTRAGGEGAEAMPTTVKVGVWLHTGRFADTSAAGVTHNNNYGVYGSVEQMVYREAEDQGLGVWFRAGGSPKDRSAYDFSFDTGLQYVGLVPGRDADAMAMGAAYTDSSTPGNAPYELALEVAYDFVVNDHMSLQPSLQRIINPGAPGAVADATVFGLRANFSF